MGTASKSSPNHCKPSRLAAQAKLRYPFLTSFAERICDEKISPDSEYRPSFGIGIIFPTT
jgi:hypothetical protein